MSKRPRAAGDASKSASRWLLRWYGPVGALGLGFGLLGERRPFGADILAHPLVVYFFIVGVALLVLRIVLRRPVPEFIPERALIIGCFIGLALYLAGNFISVHLLAY